MKKFLSTMLALIIAIPCAFALVGCGKKDEKKVMEVSVNPSVEFVLDSNDKVLTVNALNDEGNNVLQIVANSEKAFVNLNAKDAVNLFIEVTKDTGYMVSAQSEPLNISISGNAKQLLEDVKSSASEKLQALNCELQVVTEEIKKSELVTKVKDCLQEYSRKELDKMSEEELLNLLETSRRETKDFLNQEIKELYYDLRLNEIKEAKYAKVKEIAGKMQNPVGTILNSFTNSLQSFQTKFNSFKTELETQLLDQSSDYQQKLQQFLKEKQDLLDARVKNLSDEEVKALQAKVDATKALLTNAKNTVMKAFDKTKENLTTIQAQVESNLDKIIEKLSNVNIQEIQVAEANARQNFKENFLTQYAKYNKSYFDTAA